MLASRMTPVDFGRHSDDYATSRPGFPEAFYERLDRLVSLRGTRALDVGTGPGTMALELAARGGSVVGIDTSPEQVLAARRVAEERHLEGATEFHVGRAEDTALEAGSFDLVTAGQCWHWFDGEVVLKEAARVLRPGGVLAIAYYSYLARHSAVARDTEELILEFNPTWAMAGWSGVFPEHIEAVIRAGFGFVEAFCFDHDEEFSHARWRARIRTCNGVGSGGLSPSEVERFDGSLARLLADRFPDPMVVAHRVWCVVARTPSTGASASDH
jgi:SAM-dependent methyltransferase